ncbi:glycerophosphodiester phosphodiesterase [Ilumatobacter sp.]|uniref:glycerophosphodiester phosphodiesterase n=1 Tax=Ilumatobacter sp. TaxID=1967498 RepID=UPI003C6A48B9
MDVHPYLDWPGPIAFAHRGGNRAAPENTMAAFEHAVSLGYRYLETDVHLTTDGTLVAFHDPDLTRTCGIDARIGEMSSAEVAAARVDGSHEIPLMSDLFETFPDARFNIDAKSPHSVEPLVEMVRAFDAIDRVCLASFSFRSLRRMRSLAGPTLMTNMSPIEVASLRILGRPPGRRLRAAQVPPSAGRIRVVDERFVRSSRRCGMPVHVWTIDDRAEMERLLDLGVDGIMTDDCELLRDVLVQRGRWVDPA